LEFDFFIAHAGADLDSAEELYQLLGARSTVFLDSRTLLPGDDWDVELTHAQRRSRVSVVLVSSKSGAAYYQREEVAAAIAMAREDSTTHRVVPVYVDDILNREVPYGLRIKHALSLSRDGGWPGVAQRLFDLLAKMGPVGSVSDKTDVVVARTGAPSQTVDRPASAQGYFMVQCARCRGTGTRDRDGLQPACVVCGGVGQITVEGKRELFVTCSWCRGDGTRDRDGREPVCPVCRGIGGYLTDPTSVRCAACGGSGSRDRDGRMPVCKLCSGKGVVPITALKRY
jgi:hypothetical protein